MATRLRSLFQPGAAFGRQREEPIDRTGYTDNGNGASSEQRFSKGALGNYERTIEQGIGEGRAEAGRLQAEEERRGKAAEDTIRSAVDEANKPTMSELDIRRLFSQRADTGGADYLSAVNNARESLGDSGITGGAYSAGIAANLEAARLGQLTDARTSLFIEKSKADALDRLNRFNQQMTLAQQQQREPSSLMLQFMGNELGIRRDLAAIQGGIEQAKITGKAQKDAAEEANEFNPLELLPVLGGFFA